MGDDAGLADETLEGLRKAYAASLPDKVQALRAAAARLGDGRAGVDELSLLAHRLAGTSGIYKFEGLSQAARRLEDYLRRWDVDHPAGPAQMEDVARLLDEIEARGTEPDPTAAMHVLVVDDDPDVLEYLSVHLRAAGARVQAAASAEEALRLLSLSEPDLIVADVRMPGLDGYDFCRRVRAEGHNEIPFIFCSALGSVPERIEGLAVGADDYVVKPTDPAELLLRMRALVEKKRRLLRLRHAAEERRETQVLAGSLGAVSVPELLQIVAFLRFPEVTITLDSGSGKATVAVAGGRIVRAETRGLSGTKALFRVLGWTRGTFVVEHAQHEGPHSLSETIGECLLRGLAHLDEYRALRARITEGGKYLAMGTDPGLLARRFEDDTAAVLSLIEKHHHLDEVLDRSPLSDLDTLRIVSELLQTEVVSARAVRRDD